MVYKYRVTLTGIKGFYRVYEVKPEMSLYTFHKRMRADLDFPQDQLILFKALSADGTVVARYGLFDLGNGTVDAVSMAETVKAGVASFVYFYDVPNRKSVNVTFEGEEEASAAVFPALVDSKGPNPIEFENGYVAFEDLPDEKRHLPADPDSKKSIIPILDPMDEDDEDEDDEEDDVREDDDEDGKEIFDGSEELML